MAYLVGQDLTVFNNDRYRNVAGTIYRSQNWDQTPLLSLLGGLSGFTEVSQNVFNASITQDMRIPAQPAITENASRVAPAPNSAVPDAVTNVVQIFHEAFGETYDSMVNTGRILPPSGTESVTDTGYAYQLENAMLNLAGDVEFSALLGNFAAAANSGQPNTTRGLWNAIPGASTLDAQAAALSPTMLRQAIVLGKEQGARFTTPVLMADYETISSISELFGFAPASVSVGGVDLQAVNIPLVGRPVILVAHPILAEQGMDDELVIADVSVLFSVGQNVPGKGNFFVEELGKVGGATSYQIYGKFGFGHGPGNRHVKIENYTL